MRTNNLKQRILLILILDIDMGGKGDDWCMVPVNHGTRQSKASCFANSRLAFSLASHNLQWIQTLNEGFGDTHVEGHIIIKARTYNTNTQCNGKFIYKKKAWSYQRIKKVIIFR